jgi:uncharacterized protein YdeI (YjbR/CyaY-like superfamily)
MIASDRFEHVEVASEAALLAWLEAHHNQPESVWLVTWKKQVPDKHVAREAVLDALTAYGWTDGVMRRIDDERVMQLVSPRRQQRWAQSDKDRAERLLAAGRMQPAGLAAIARAKASGLWDAMADVDALAVPPDLADALAQLAARDRWDALPPSYRRNVLRWLALARTASTRDRRIAAAAETTAAGRRLPQM